MRFSLLGGALERHRGSPVRQGQVLATDTVCRHSQAIKARAGASRSICRPPRQAAWNCCAGMPKSIRGPFECRSELFENHPDIRAQPSGTTYMLAARPASERERRSYISISASVRVSQPKHRKSR
jgi:hypothetical protein